MPRRRRKPDPNQGELFPGFNMGGSESAPSPQNRTSAPLGFTGGPVGASRVPRPRTDAAAAYSAAEASLNPPRAMPSGIPGFTGRPAPPGSPGPSPASGRGGWSGAAQRALSAPQGVSPLAAMGPYGAAADLALRGAKAAFKPTPYGNFDTKIVQNLSGEGQDQWYGRGTDRPGLYAANTSKKFASANGRPMTTNPREIRDYYPEEHMGGPESVATGAVTGHPFTHAEGLRPPESVATGAVTGHPFTHAEGLRPPGPAADYMHQSRTSGTGTPWFDTHTATTSGINTAGVQPIRAQTDE